MSASKQAEAEAMLRRDEAVDILRQKLPRSRKLKVVKQRLTTVLIELMGEPVGEGVLVLLHIMAMTKDDPAFARARTTEEYLKLVGDYLRADPVNTPKD